VCDTLDQLDLAAIYSAYSNSDRGQPPFDAMMMLRLLLHGYGTGVRSSRKIEQKSYEDVAFRLLAANQHPDHDTIAEFRKRHRDVFQNVFVQVLQLCEQAGMVKLGEVALDGTKVKANASKHKAMSYDRMVQRERELRDEVQRLMQQAEEADEQDDRRHGKGRRGDWSVPEELAVRQKRLQKLQEAKQALESAARQHAEEEQREREELERKAQEEGRAVAGRAPKIDPTPQPKAKAKAQRNFTDPESKIMKGSDGFVQAFNAQAVVDSESQVIVAADVTDSPVDARQAQPMMRQVKENLGTNPARACMDAGYLSEENVTALVQAGIDPYIATGRQKHGELRKERLGGPSPQPHKGRIPKAATCKERMRRKLKTKRGQAIYARRKTIVEPVLGQIKNLGFRQFSMRGRQNARAEWKLVCATHNLLKLFRSDRRPRLN
jgi:transposase